MPDSTSQSFKNHAKFDPLFHFFLAPFAAISCVIALWNAIRNPTFNSIWIFLIAVAATVAVFRIRIYSLKVQDRIIRLEERLRLSQCLPEGLRSRIGELTERQLIALRFASDEELPGLAQKALQENMQAPDIKKAIVHWRPDFFRV